MILKIIITFILKKIRNLFQNTFENFFLVQEKGFLFFETSVKNNININQRLVIKI